MTVYGATKAFVLFLSQDPSLELAPRGVYVQAVLPATITTLPDAARREVFEAARQAMLPNCRNALTAARYRTVQPPVAIPTRSTGRAHPLAEGSGP